MSDGPYKSLPMRRQWKELAKRAEAAAYSADEVREALPHALLRDFREAPLQAVREILAPSSQGLPLPDETVRQLEHVREKCRGSAVGNALVDCAIEAVRENMTGDGACERALSNALDESARSSFRQIEEHYRREAGGQGAQNVRDRLDAARRQTDFTRLASDIMSQEPRSVSTAQPVKKTGIDEGPEL